MKQPFRLRRKDYIYSFFAVVFVLFLVRLVFPSVRRPAVQAPEEQVAPAAPVAVRPASPHSYSTDSLLRGAHDVAPDLTTQGSATKHKIWSVPSYDRCFPDVNDVQLAAAQRWGVPPVANRQMAEHSKDKLVYIADNPYYHVNTLYSSIPYLVPRAQLLLTKIGRNFLDSQYVKHVRPSKLRVTSVLRTQEDVLKLSKHNTNVSQNSCHQYGTTFDISYNKYYPVGDPDCAPPNPTRNDTLKFILSEVLRDLRAQGLCYVKHERKQGCYHITVR